MDLKSICADVVELVNEVGDFITQEAVHFATDKIEYKGLNDLVSYVDKEAEQKIIQKLALLLPHAHWVTEENGTYPKDFYLQSHEYFWIVDPLDGTTNFIHGIPTYAISIALYRGNEPQIGVVYEINRKEVFYTYKDAPAYLNGNEISVSHYPSINQGLVATGFPYYNFEHQKAYMDLLSEVMQNCHGIRRIGAAAVDLAYVACGRFEAFFEYNLKPWDIAAGAFLVQQAGGKATNFKNNASIFEANEILASNTKVHVEMTQMIQKYF